MNLAERYRSAVASRYDVTASDDGLLPQVLAEACVQVLPVAGAGISVMQDDLRIPLGASDAVAQRAERLQTTLGEGPCLAAAGTPLPQAASLDTIAQSWPLFHRELVAQTPYRSACSVPLLPDRGRRLGVLDFYLTTPEAMEPQLLFSLSASVGSAVAGILSGSPVAEGVDGLTMPTWLNSAPVQERMTVWAAVGILLAQSQLDNADALALMRAFAFGQDLSLDAVAARLTSSTLDPAEVLGLIREP